MAEIKCPNCGEIFTVDESGYAQIVQQVRDREFEKELQRRKEELERNKENEVKLAGIEKDEKMRELESTVELLKKEIESQDEKKKVAVLEAVQEKNNEITKLNAEKISLEQKYSTELKAKDDLIDQYKDFKARLSTKMLGESLEQHCSNEFNKIRMTAFPNAYFEKDNNAKDGSKGDFIFRECSDDGIEFISIMFEMKNEMDTTATKHKNEDFFKKLDKDRCEKGCEYAVLVSMLEMDNELYNNGIVDVSYKYEKMYVIRPQFFIPIITLLRNAAMKTLDYRRQLAEVKAQQLDISQFEENLNNFKSSFLRNYTLASDHFEKAIDAIDKSIKQMEKIKSELQLSIKHLSTANNKAEDLTIKKLTKGAPIAEAMFEALKQD